MKTFIWMVLVAAGLFQTIPGFAQNLIAVQNSEAPAFYSSLDSANLYASDGDTLYIPGGSYNAITITKRLHLVGVGHNPDSTIATNKTVISQIILKSGSNEGTLTGCHIKNTFSVRAKVNQYSVTSCYLNAGISFDSVASNFLIAENVIGYFGQGCLYGGTHSIVFNGQNNLVTNNIILGDIKSSMTNTFKNNIFLYSTTWCGILSGNTNDNFENNIFNSGGTSSFFNCISKNNLGLFSNGIDNNNNQGSNNFSLSVPVDTVFVSYNSGWSYSSNLHLRNDSPYKNAGTDGTDIGIYGGAFPWKEGSAPFNPHFQEFKVSPKTDANGNLNVTIKVAAQEN